MRYTFISLVWILACTAVPDPQVPVEPVVDRVEVQLAAGATSPFERVKAAFINDGLQIATASADGGIVTSVPVTFRPGATFPSEYSYRGVVVVDGNGSKVVLSATLRTLKQGDYSTTAPLTSVCKRYPGHECNEAWTRLERIADRLRIP
jgi:hypothetical protein